MDGTGTRIFNFEFVRSITERWHLGGVGILYIRYDQDEVACAKIFESWVKQQNCLFWRLHLINEHFLFFHCTGPEYRVEDHLAEAASELTETMLNAETECYAGVAIACPKTEIPAAEETGIFQAIKEAVFSSLRSVQGRKVKPASDAGSSSPVNERKVGYSSSRIGELTAPVPKFFMSAKVSEVAKLFESNPKVQGAVIVENERPVGLVMKEKLHQLLAGQFGLPLYWNRSVEKIMDDNPLIVDESLPVEQVSQMAMNRDFGQLYDIVIMTKHGKLTGAASIRSILEKITSMRTEAALTANPLTGLPGNEGIQREMALRIESRTPFSVIYADLDYFKWFNDRFGFRKGDELIRYTAELFQQVINLSGAPDDFVGHIGGDDFIVMTEAADPEMLCRQLIWRFDGGVKTYYGNVEVTTVEDRHGNALTGEGVTLSLSLMVWDGLKRVTPDTFSSLSAVLKKKAKSIAGSGFVMEKIGELQHEKGRT